MRRDARPEVKNNAPTAAAAADAAPRRQVRLPARQLLAVPADRHGLQLGRPTDLRWELRVLRRPRVHVRRGVTEAPAARAVPVLMTRCSARVT